MLATFLSFSAIQKARAVGNPDPAVLRFAIFGAGDKADSNTTGTGKSVDVIGGMVGGNRKVTVRGGSNVTGVRSGADTYIGNDADVASDGDVDNGQEAEGALNATSGIIANGKVTLTQKSDTTGNISGEQIRVGVKASVTGNVVVAGKLQIVNSGRITGNADATSTSIGNNTKITGTLKLPVGVNPTGSGINNGSATIGTVLHGAPQAPQTFSKIQLPQARTYTAATAATADRTVANGGSLTLAPGTYRDIELKQNATLNLSNGTYVVRKFKTAAKSTLNLNVTGGDIIILATDDVNLGQYLSSNLTGGTAKNVYLETAATFSTSANSNWNGTVFSTKSNSPGQDGIAIGQKNTVVGALYSNQQVHVAANSTVTYQVANSFAALFAPSDSTAPVITPTVAGTLGANGWYVSDVTVTWSVTDAESAISSSTGCGPTTLNTDTTGTTLTCSATNAASLTASNSVTIKIDKTAPTITGSRLPAANANGWNNTDVTVSFVCADATSGIDTCSGPTTLTTEGSGQTVSGNVTDLAGNSASANVTVSIDKTMPVVSIVLPSNGGKYTQDSIVAANYTCTDPLSGMAFCGGDIGSGANLDTSVLGNKTFTVIGTDKAGNIKSVTVNYEIIEGIVSYAIFGAGDNADGNTTSVGHNVNIVGGLIGGNRKVVIRGGSNAVGIRSGADTYMGNDSGGEDAVEGALGVTLGIIANGDVTLTQKASVLGNIDGKTLRVGTSASVQGNAVISLGLTMLSNAIITSNADAATASLGTNASILGTLKLPIGISPSSASGAFIGTLVNGTPKTPKTFIKYAMPVALTYTASSLVADDKTVANGTTLTLAPGTYRDLDMKTGSTLNLSAGTYVFRNINSAANSIININVASGAINILATNNVGFGTALTVNVTGGSAKKVYWETAGNFDTSADTTWVGTVFATKSNAPGTASVSIGSSNTVTGALFSNQQVHVTGDSNVTRSVADAFSSRIP